MSIHTSSNLWLVISWHFMATLIAVVFLFVNKIGIVNVSFGWMCHFASKCCISHRAPFIGANWFDFFWNQKRKCNKCWIIPKSNWARSIDAASLPSGQCKPKTLMQTVAVATTKTTSFAVVEWFVVVTRLKAVASPTSKYFSFSFPAQSRHYPIEMFWMSPIYWYSLLLISVRLAWNRSIIVIIIIFIFFPRSFPPLSHWNVLNVNDLKYSFSIN